jgi:hypothetical protein
VIGAIIFLLGLVWFLQGVGVLPGSVMSGSQFWAVAGGITAIVGFGPNRSWNRSRKGQRPAMSILFMIDDGEAKNSIF